MKQNRRSRPIPPEEEAMAENPVEREPLICDGCRVRWPHEHRCHRGRMQIQGEPVAGWCACPDCAELYSQPVEHGDIGTP